MTNVIDQDMAEVITLHAAGQKLSDKIMDPLVSLRTNLERLEEAANESLPEMLEALENMRYSAHAATELRDAVLAEHRDYHAEVSPRFCTSEPCRKAADDW